MILPATDFVRKVCRQGPRGVLETMRHRAYERFCDWRLQIDTRGYSDGHDLADGQRTVAHEPIDYGCLDAALRRLDVRSDEDVFLDYGSGKGRAVVQAAMKPFRRVIGVEWSPELCDIARQNVHRAQSRLRCRNISIICGEATRYVVPPDVTHVYLFNPFQGTVLAQVQQQLRESLTIVPRALTILYVHPRNQHDPFADVSWLTLAEEIPVSKRREARFAVYKASIDPR